MAVAKQGILQKRIKKPSVANTVMQRVYDALLEGEIKPGDLLPSEAELSEQLNVGKSSVREAIKMLSAIGVVESVQGEGTFIRTSIDEAAKQQAIQDMIRLTEISEKENAAETLLMAKGFSDPVVSITDDKVDVVIHASSITDPERAQIEDIVKRKAEVGADQIIITLLNMAD